MSLIQPLLVRSEYFSKGIIMRVPFIDLKQRFEEEKDERIERSSLELNARI